MIADEAAGRHQNLLRNGPPEQPVIADG
jgi:hypothetical protein